MNTVQSFNFHSLIPVIFIDSYRQLSITKKRGVDRQCRSTVSIRCRSTAVDNQTNGLSIDTVDLSTRACRSTLSITQKTECRSTLSITQKNGLSIDSVDNQNSLSTQTLENSVDSHKCGKLEQQYHQTNMETMDG